MILPGLSWNNVTDLVHVCPLTMIVISDIIIMMPGHIFRIMGASHHYG